MAGEGQTFGAQLEEMRKAAVHVEDVAAQIKAQLTQFMGQVGNTPDVWRGQSPGAFMRVSAAWNQRVERLNTVLDEYADMIRGSRVGYATADVTHADAQAKGYDALDGATA